MIASSIFVLCLILQLSIAQGCGNCQINNSFVNPYLQNTTTTLVTELDDIGTLFYPVNGAPPVGGGPPGPVQRGFIFIADTCVKPKSYAPYLTQINADGYASVAIITNGGEEKTLSRVLKVMEKFGNQFQMWAIGGHGVGGTWASRIARALHPKIKGLILLGAVPDSTLNWSGISIVVAVASGSQDSVVTPAMISASSVGLPANTYFTTIQGASHSDFAFYHGNSCIDPNDTPSPNQQDVYNQLVGNILPAPINAPSFTRVTMTILQIFDVMPEALLYAGNSSFSRYVVTPTYFGFVPTQNTPRVGYVYHTGAAVPPEAYFPYLRPLADKGFVVLVLRLPNNYGLLAINQSATAIADFPGIAHWVIGGHSLGAVSASWYASIDPRVSGLILHDSGPRHNMASTNVKVIYVYGAPVDTGDRVPPTSLPALLYFTRLPNTTIYYPVEGGNHYQFGWYGYQAPIAPATISRQDQTRTLVESSFLFMGQFSRS